MTAVQASRQYGAASGSVTTVKHEHDTVNLNDAAHMVRNGVSAPGGNAFLGLVVSTPSPLTPYTLIHEVQQYKLVRTAVTQKMFDAEYEKSVKAGTDLFLLFTAVKERNVSTPKARSGLVDATCFRDYYGPFAGRAFVALHLDDAKLNINTAPRLHLEAVNSVGPVMAERIMQKRKEAPFTGPDDARTRTKLSSEVLGMFTF
jgi:hypothetical protein